MEAIMAGKNPDIMLSQGTATILNFAIRGALLDFKQFKDFDEAVKDFHPSAIVPFMYKDGCYSLPETQTFLVMFYRKDVLAELGADVPQTWEDFYRILPLVQRSNMEIGLPSIIGDVGAASTTNAASQAMFTTFLLQNGGSYYNENLTRTALDEPEALAAFLRVVELYTHYEFPTAFDFGTRFRRGEMPIGINGYSGFNALSIFTPEIKGLWDVAPIPGTLRPDGSIDRSEGSDVSGPLAMSNTKNKDHAWEFIKWYVSADTQVRWGLENEALFGPSARYSTANIEAMKRLPWTADERDRILAQWQFIKGIPETPGSYYVPIGLMNALQLSVTGRANPVMTYKYWVDEINAELERKQDEFNFNR